MATSKRRREDGSRGSAFVHFTNAVARYTGSEWAFIGAVGLMVLWLISGPLFHFSNTWQLVVNTGTTVMTFLMVFVIQATQNRDSVATHVKLDELIASSEKAHDKLIGLERKNDAEIERERERLEEETAGQP